MKSLQFSPANRDLILSGEKTATVRLDDVDHPIGGRTIALQTGAGQKFGEAKVKGVLYPAKPKDALIWIHAVRGADYQHADPESLINAMHDHYDNYDPDDDYLTALHFTLTDPPSGGEDGAP
jgi:hypothetical protein